MALIDLGAAPDWLPDACTLPTVERPLRLAEFDGLFASVSDVHRPDASHAVLTLAGSPGLAGRARDLAERETACCSFFTFDVTTGERPSGPAQEEVRMSIAVPEAHRAVLEALVDRAERLARG